MPRFHSSLPATRRTPRLSAMCGVCAALFGLLLAGCRLPNTAGVPGGAVLPPLVHSEPQTCPRSEHATSETSARLIDGSTLSTDVAVDSRQVLSRAEASSNASNELILTAAGSSTDRLELFPDLASGDCPSGGGRCGYRQYAFEDDLEQFGGMLWEDTKGIVNWNNAAILGAALGGAIAMRQDLDQQVRDSTSRHPERWGNGTKALGWLAEPQYQLPALFAVYGVSLKRQDAELHSLSGSLLSAYSITGLSTVAIKVVANTDRPSEDWNGGQFGFPSFHASSSFAMAAVLDDYYGHEVGLPAYALAGLISWSRIDERDHDLSDVVFGAALGYVIGKSVAGGHLYGDSRVRLLPYFHPTEGAGGLMAEVPF